MLIKQKQSGYSSKRKLIHGKGFVDSLSSMLNSFKTTALPTLQNIGSYVSQNKDLIAKPLLSAVGDFAATGLLLTGKRVLNRLLNEKSTISNKNVKADSLLNKLGLLPQLDEKDREIIQSLQNEISTTNILGSGIKKSRK